MRSRNFNLSIGLYEPHYGILCSRKKLGDVSLEVVKDVLPGVVVDGLRGIEVYGESAAYFEPRSGLVATYSEP